MTTDRKRLTQQKFLQAGAGLVYAVVTWRYGAPLWDSEFAGGWLTGKLLGLEAVGMLLLAVSVLLTVLLPRICAVGILISGLISLPLYLFFLAPGPFRWVFRGDHSVPALGIFVWDNWSGAALVTALLSMFVAVQTLGLFGREVDRGSIR
jgi:hypothetical protein